MLVVENSLFEVKIKWQALGDLCYNCKSSYVESLYVKYSLSIFQDIRLDKNGKHFLSNVPLILGT